MVQFSPTPESFLAEFKTRIVGLTKNARVAIKINCSKPPGAYSPQTDPAVLELVVHALLDTGCTVALVEGGNGYLPELLEGFGLSRHTLDRVDVVDIDRLKDVDRVLWDGKEYFLPAMLKDFDFRIACPAATKKPGYLFSNNVKTFVGLLPRQFCRKGTNPSFSRPSIHDDLHRSVMGVYLSFQRHSQFDLYINGGNVLFENRPSASLDGFLMSDDGLALDVHVLDAFDLEYPEYIQMLLARR